MKKVTPTARRNFSTPIPVNLQCSDGDQEKDDKTEEETFQGNETVKAIIPVTIGES